MGVLFEDQIETSLRSPVQVAVLLIVFGVVLFVADRWGQQVRQLEELTWKDALLIGTAQVLALAPGVSRSGITLSAGRLRGFQRAEAARYSFLLATPLILGAGLVALVKITRQGMPAEEGLAFLIGMVTAALVGVAVIGAVLSFLRRHSVTIFVVYRFLAGIVLLTVFSLIR
jgi:undecaprenyl-diphosphatase